MTKLAKYFLGTVSFWIAFFCAFCIIAFLGFLLLGFEGFDEVNLDWGELILVRSRNFSYSVSASVFYFCRYTLACVSNSFPDSVRKSSSFLIQSFIYIGTWLFAPKFGKVKIEVDYAIEHINSSSER